MVCFMVHGGLNKVCTSKSRKKLQEVEIVARSTSTVNTIFLGIDPTPDVIAIATIYFVEGALGIARLAQTFLLKDELHLGPAELSALSGIFTLPWTVKPIYGFLSDGFPLFGYRRRSYLILAGVTGCFSYSAVGHNFWGLLDNVNNVGDGSSTMVSYTIAALVLSSACIAVSDVVADGIVVQKTRESAKTDPSLAGGLQSLCWGSAAVGGLLSAYFSGSLLEVMKPQDVFSLTAILPLLVALIANDFIDIQSQIESLWNAIKQPAIYKPALFIFLWQSTPTSDGAMLFFQTENLGFGPEFLGRVRLLGAFSSLFGIWLYNTYLKNKSIKDILFWATIISFPLGLLDLVLITHANRLIGIPDNWFIFGDDVVLSVLGEIAFLPTLVLAARICPIGVEAVLFATLMSINNGAGVVGTEIGALLTKALGVTESNFDNLWLLSLICNLTSLYPLLFIGWLDEVGTDSEQEIEEQQKEAAALLAIINSSATDADEYFLYSYLAFILVSIAPGYTPMTNVLYSLSSPPKSRRWASVK
ncbi:BT1-domain-containing protein [Fragilariopsis cylindrus CCMP1102]|uniref:BT1-domain-containing protein n=1 Tax=Fragilariopsis cylindrus CCMP1102 TaxID=635003 RepID=A0A1E7F211_9STRA|nr:BT1-domain-containing protein [Fragilariopsis cylindrus CCMP1102]|eukprot:OEU12222.1 BT1-domain-containing protein [Fragilariopsis cylindrus CCMP1102]